MPNPERSTSTSDPRPAVDAKFGHVNLVANDWRRLAGFYTAVFGCVLIPPERDYSGADFERGSGVAGAKLRGAHLRLPGYASAGPTIEIFEYAQELDSLPPAANRPGWGHIAFGVVDVRVARDVVLREGGSRVGEVVTLETSDGRRVEWTYVTDPEGNILELQTWFEAGADARTNDIRAR